MKMKKALSIILGGALLVSSSTYIFANDGIKATNPVSQETIIENENAAGTNETTMQDPKTPTVTIEVLDEIVDTQNNTTEIDNDDKELNKIIEEVLNELEKDKDDEVDEDESNKDEDNSAEDEKLTTEKLYSKLLKFQLVYDKVPAQAKPAIEKNMKNVQLKIVEHMIKANKDLATLIPNLNIEETQNQIATLKKSLENDQLSEEQKQSILEAIGQLEIKITSHEELVKLVDFIRENEHWKKELKHQIHQEFKEEKAKVKAETKRAKEEAKQAKELLKQQGKSNKESYVNIHKVMEDPKEDVQFEMKINDKSNDNEKKHKKSHPIKESHPGKGHGKNK